MDIDFDNLPPGSSFWCKLMPGYIHATFCADNEVVATRDIDNESQWAAMVRSLTERGFAMLVETHPTATGQLVVFRDERAPHITSNQGDSEGGRR